MAHFRGTLKGHRGEASRLGTKKSGLCVTANGWEIGARIRLDHDTDTGQDFVSISLTHGSNGGGSCRCLGRFNIDDLKKREG